ncbi:MAG: hypothetical protein PHV66_10955 [Bacteroidales bacterium]|nr:hypothetical protein [Bacteroidales bacterium]
MDRDNQGTRNGLDKCLNGLNMNLMTGMYNMQQLILVSGHLYLKGNLLDNLLLANSLGLLNINYNLDRHQLREWNEKGSITLGSLDYQNITYIPKWVHDLIVFK